MNQAIGLIEIETDETLGPLSFMAEDDTLDGLFARLVSDSTTDFDSFSEGADVATTVLAANLAALSDDLTAAARGVLAELFLSIGCR